MVVGERASINDDDFERVKLDAVVGGSADAGNCQVGDEMVTVAAGQAYDGNENDDDGFVRVSGGSSRD